MSRGNNIRGPTSALTDFLKASGITHTTIARRVRTAQTDQQPVAGPSTTTSAAAAGTSASARSTTRRTSSRRVSGYASDDLDESEGEDAARAAAGDAMDVDGDDQEKTISGKKRKRTKATEAKLKAKQKKKKGSDDDDDDEDAYTALSKSLWSNGTSKPPVGSFENCAVCEKQFTVTKYTLAASSGTGFLCHQCAKAGGNDPFKKPASPKKRRATDKRSIINFEEKRFPTLVSICIQLITKHIDDIEALGDIGSLNVEAISKALSKNRGLTPENVHLFYDSGNSSLALFDATNLPSPALETLAYHNANLTSLRLDFCGQLDDTSFKVFSASLPSLQRLELLGPFLVRPGAWQAFFKSHSKLEAFLITQSPRFNEACMKSLVTNCPDIIDLRLKEIGHMNDAFVDQIKLLKGGLRYLDLSDPTESCTDSAMIALMRSIGKSITHLNVSKHILLGDEFLSKGLQPHANALQSLNLSRLPELTDEGVSKFFSAWKNPPLLSLNMSRNEVLGSLSLKSLLKHSGKLLEELNINGWKDVGDDALKLIGQLARELKKLDVGWCRAVDDFLLKLWFEGELVLGVKKGGCESLQELKVWGCNKISHSCPRKKGTIILGVESHISLRQ